MSDPTVEVVVIRDPSSQTSVSVYVDGVAVDCQSVVIDAGHGWEWDDWRAFRDATLAEPSSPACRAELIDVFDDPPGGEYVMGRGRTQWLDGVDPEDRLACRYRLTGPRAVAVTVPADTDLDTVALTYLRAHLPEGHDLLHHVRRGGRAIVPAVTAPCGIARNGQCGSCRQRPAGRVFLHRQRCRRRVRLRDRYR